MFNVPDVAVFRIEEGVSIHVSPVPECDPGKIRLYVLGTCMGILLLQRGILPLHGSAVAIDGKAYAIVGHSGAGKSTLATVLLNMGFQLLSDDVIPLVLAHDHTAIIFPSYPQQKLWQDSMDKLGMNGDGCQPLFDREQKFAVPVQSRFRHEPMPLGGVFELVCDESGPGIQAVEGLERFHTLLRHTFRRSVMEQMGLMEWHFGMLVRFVNQLPVHRIVRPSSAFTALDLGSLLLQTIRKEKIS
ncbi:hypothetical protein GCM10010911_33810 [Paenibacillus nasutitermitis]|uniref:Aldolase n=2 Tax=Paenibacillus nasutitermitis TaxID=1652958 RepID=A0A916Z2P1_9BACL|nr:hypothetical protein GCM10010911_33810 [Paenibacillus nasutitermitis]